MKTGKRNKITAISPKDISKAIFTFFPPVFDKKPDRRACKLSQMLNEKCVVILRNSAKKILKNLSYHNSVKRKSTKTKGVSITSLPDNHKLKSYTSDEILANKINNLFRNFRVFGFSKTAESYNTSSVSKIRRGGEADIYHQHFMDGSCTWIVEYAVLKLAAELSEGNCIGLQYADRQNIKEALPVEVILVTSINPHENFKFANAVPVLSQTEVSSIIEDINTKLATDRNLKNIYDFFSRREREEVFGEDSASYSLNC